MLLPIIELFHGRGLEHPKVALAVEDCFYSHFVEKQRELVATGAKQNTDTRHVGHLHNGHETVVPISLLAKYRHEFGASFCVEQPKMLIISNGRSHRPIWKYVHSVRLSHNAQLIFEGTPSALSAGPSARIDAATNRSTARQGARMR